MGDPTDNSQGICEGDRIRGRGEVARAVVGTDGCGMPAEYHTKRDFGSSVVETATGIRQAW